MQETRFRRDLLFLSPAQAESHTARFRNPVRSESHRRTNAVRGRLRSPQSESTDGRERRRGMDLYDRIVAAILSAFAVAAALVWLFRFGFTPGNILAWMFGTAFIIVVLWEKLLYPIPARKTDAPVVLVDPVMGTIDNPRCYCPDCGADLGSFYSNRIVMRPRKGGPDA